MYYMGITMKKEVKGNYLNEMSDSIHFIYPAFSSFCINKHDSFKWTKGKGSGNNVGHNRLK